MARRRLLKPTTRRQLLRKQRVLAQPLGPVRRSTIRPCRRRRRQMLIRATPSTPKAPAQTPDRQPEPPSAMIPTVVTAPSSMRVPPTRRNPTRPRVLIRRRQPFQHLALLHLAPRPRSTPTVVRAAADEEEAAEVATAAAPPIRRPREISWSSLRRLAGELSHLI